MNAFYIMSGKPPGESCDNCKFCITYTETREVITGGLFKVKTEKQTMDIHYCHRNPNNKPYINDTASNWCGEWILRDNNKQD